MHSLIGTLLAATAMSFGAQAGQHRQEFRPITLKGCVQATGDPTRFLLAVPALFPDAIRGIETGQPVPDGAGAGPAPRRDPRTIPPTDLPRPESRLPDGRYATPTMRHLIYRLLNVGPADLKTLQKHVGAEIEVTGAIPVEGFPSGDAPRGDRAADAKATPELPPLRVETIKKVADDCGVPGSSERR